MVESNAAFQKTAGDLGAIDDLCEILKNLAVKEVKKDNNREEDVKKPKVLVNCAQ